MSQPIVFFDIAGQDDSKLRGFYSSIFGWDSDQTGQFSVEVASPIQGAIRGDPTEKRIYVGVPDVAAALAEIEHRGGTMKKPRQPHLIIVKG